MDTELMTHRPPTRTKETFPTPLFAACPGKSLRIPLPALTPRPQFRGDRAYLRALRAAEMKAWQASGGDVFRPHFAE